MFGYFCVKKRIGVTALLVCLVVAAIRVPRVVQYDVMNRSVQKARYCICIDSGHGGNDPGKIGVAGTKEKEVNLAIALKLKKSLEKQNIRVVMTRTDGRCECNKRKNVGYEKSCGEDGFRAAGCGDQHPSEQLY